MLQQLAQPEPGSPGIFSNEKIQNKLMMIQKHNITSFNSE